MASQGCGKNCVIDPAPSDRENALLAAQCGVCMPCASLSTEEAAFSPRKYLDSRLKIFCRPESLWVRTNPSDSELAADETDKVLVTGSDEADSDLVIAEKGAECTCSGAMEGAGGSVGSTALDVEQLDEEDVRLTNPDTADASCETVVDLALISISFSRQAAARAVGRCSASVFHPSLMTLARAEFRIKCVDGRRLTRDAWRSCGCYHRAVPSLLLLIQLEGVWQVPGAHSPTLQREGRRDPGRAESHMI